MMMRFIVMSILICTFLKVNANNNILKETDREVWVATAVKLADPILTNLANETLKKNMANDAMLNATKEYAYLEGFGRLVCGIAPWLELGADGSKEGRIRAKYIDLTLKSISNIVDPNSPDYLVFYDKNGRSQPLVDAAFLAQGLLRAPTQLWARLDKTTQQRLIEELKKTRNIDPPLTNWVLFASIVEAAILQFTGECDVEKLIFGVNLFKDKYYKGDAHYGDGHNFHMDYYNSFVIHPMLTDVLVVMDKHKISGADFLDTQLDRHGRYAAILERFISPEGTFPAVGRSIIYRSGAMYALSQAALLNILPAEVTPAQVRCALTKVIVNMFGDDHNFDAQGWLTIGFNGGEQRDASDSYINTGSLYLCSTILLPLGLPTTDEFWSAPDAEWTNLKAWSGGRVKLDKAIKN